MTAPSQDEEAIFDEARQRPSGRERADFVDQACASNEPLKLRVLELLAAHDVSHGALDQPLSYLNPTLASSHERPGTLIGPYKLLEQIGEGGFGVVFLTEQTHPVCRRVALKVVKPGMDTRQVIARFEAERQALAIMDHPNIAKVFDGGVTSSGRPYFVMELVRGVPITEFCDQNHLTPRQRLELFASVCQAVQHAHQKGIIHRDLKPSNVLVSRHDATPVVKVIDFGVAKALGQKLTDKTVFTSLQQMIGTPLYMSPEQAGMSDLDIDTRSDIYSLGVLLYELLTGATPFTKDRFQQAAYDEILRIIREEEPPKPSTKLSTAEGLPTLAANRGTEPSKLTKLVRGELDWIVMKALEKDRSRRYETASGLAMDVQRYLADEPVLACPPSTTYRLRKFVRRNQFGLSVAALVLFFLTALGSAVGWTVRDRAAREAAVAQERANREAEISRERESRRAKVAGQVESILAEVERLEKEQRWPEALAAARRAEAAVAGGEADAETAERVRQRLKDLEFIDRLERIRMQRATLVQGNWGTSRANQEYALAFSDYGVNVKELPVETAIERLNARPALAIPVAAALDDWFFFASDAVGNPAAWDQSLRLVGIAGAIDREPLRHRLRSTWQQPISRRKDELRQLAASIDIRAQQPATLVVLAASLRWGKETDAALRVLRDAQRVYPGDFWLNSQLGYELLEHKDYVGATRFHTAAVALRPQSAFAHDSLGNTLFHQGKLDDAIAAYRKAIELDARFANAHGNLGAALAEQGNLDDGIAALRKAIELDPKNISYYENLGIALNDQQKWDEAIALCRLGIEQVGPNSKRSAGLYLQLGKALEGQGKLDETIACFEKTVELDPKNTVAHNALVWVLTNCREVKLRDPKRGLEVAVKAVELGPQWPFTWKMLGWAHYRAGDWKASIEALEKSCTLEDRPKGGDPYAWFFLAMAHWQLGEKDTSRKWYDRAVEWMDKHEPKGEDLRRFRTEAAELLEVDEKS